MAATTLLFGVLRPLNTLGARNARALSKAQLEYAGGVGQASRLAEETQAFGVGTAQQAQVDGLIDTARARFYRTQLLARLTPNVYQSMVYLILVGGLWLLVLEGGTRQHIVSLGAVVLILLRAGSYGQGVQGSWRGCASRCRSSSVCRTPAGVISTAPCPRHDGPGARRECRVQPGLLRL